MIGTSGLDLPHRVAVRKLATNAAMLGYYHRDVLHYTQDQGYRWEGIRTGRLAKLGHYPNHADCSAFASWCLWNGLREFGVHDVVNGLNFAAGYTGTMLQHGNRVTDGSLLRGDLVIYGSGWPGAHVAIAVGDGKVVSFGSEPGPFLLPWNYRRDVLQVRRFI